MLEKKLKQRGADFSRSLAKKRGEITLLDFKLIFINE